MRTLKMAIIVCAGLLIGAPALAKDCKIGYIEVPRILEEYEGYKKARKDLEKMRADREEEFKQRAAELENTRRKLQESLKLLSETKRREKEEEFMSEAQELEKWRLTQNKELTDREEGLLKRLESDVRKALDRIAKKGGYLFVVRKDIMLYMTEDATDLTDKVLDTLQKVEKEK